MMKGKTGDDDWRVGGWTGMRKGEVGRVGMMWEVGEGDNEEEVWEGNDEGGGGGGEGGE